jgi:hypothetical protein
MWFNPETKELETLSSKPDNRIDKFISGPIPLIWMIQANALPGKTSAVAIALWFLAGVKKTKTFKLTGQVQEIACCTRQSFYKALDCLEKAGLITQHKVSGRRSEISILEVKTVTSLKNN